MSIRDVCQNVVDHYRHNSIAQGWVTSLDTLVLGEDGKDLASRATGYQPANSDDILSAFVEKDALSLLQGTNPFWVALVLKETTKIVPNSRHFQRFSRDNIIKTMRRMRGSYNVIFDLSKPLAQLNSKDYLNGQKHGIFLINGECRLVPNPVFYCNLD